ncbi:hypothetical protein [Amycolatopsis sp. YIM 10]|uniref:hypothetical protein n=1 Tax=Amycolatopsis sp. YIM 10 TaxID=2653857 RepID=UPI0012900E49|nr:hypothetical protein [Amycolatopsis sp. YIM 10]QFU92441.1 hypothetical protein YIM_36410 [Amycolatopsis sp. YIM 10]
MRQKALRGLALLAAAVLVSVGTAAPASAEPVVTVPASAFTMTRTDTTGAAEGIRMVKASLSSILTSASWQATRRGACTPFPAQPDWWCFTDGDNQTREWIPQGVSSVNDAQEDQVWGSHKGIMVSWYDDEDWTGNDGEEDDHVLKKKGVRVSVLNTQTGKYQHILLVEPFHGANGEVSYRPVDIHAGGMVWYGRFLYLVDTNWGIRQFSLDAIYDLVADPRGYSTNKYLVGYEPVADRFYSHGYRYIMAQSGFWKSPKSSGGKCSTDPGAPLRDSWVSLDRVSTPDRLVVGEFCEAETGLPGRVVTWDMSDHQIASNARGVATADSAFRQPGLTGGVGNRTQGGVTHDGGTTWHFNSSDGPGNNGLMRSWRLGSDWTLTRSAATPNGPEDMSYWRETGLIWSVSEYHGRRMLYGIAP